MKTSNILIALVALSVFTAGCETFKETVSTAGNVLGDDEMAAAKSNLTPAQVTQIGHDMSASILKKYPMVEDEKVQSYISKVGQYVTMHLDNGPKNIKCNGGKEKRLPEKGFRFIAVKTNDKVAVSLPGGYVYVSTGMLKTLKTEDQLAGVLAHEATHIVCQDGLAEIENAALKKGVGKAAEAGMGLAKESGLGLDANITGNDEVDGAISDEATDAAAGLIEKAYEKFFQNPFSREQEKVADRGALMATYRSGYYPGDFVALAEGMKEEKSSRHPASADRVTWMKKDFVKMQKKGVVNTQKARAARFAAFQKAL